MLYLTQYALYNEILNLSQVKVTTTIISDPVTDWDEGIYRLEIKMIDGTTKEFEYSSEDEVLREKMAIMKMDSSTERLR